MGVLSTNCDSYRPPGFLWLVCGSIVLQVELQTFMKTSIIKNIFLMICKAFFPDLQVFKFGNQILNAYYF